MRSVTAVLLRHTLCAILDHIEQTPNLDPDYPGLVEFEAILIRRIEQLQKEEPFNLLGQVTSVA